MSLEAGVRSIAITSDLVEMISDSDRFMTFD